MRVFSVLIMVVAIAGCTKQKTDHFMFDCTVFDQKINAAVEGVSVVMKVQRVTGGFNPNWETVGTTVTDASGNFYLEVEKEVFYAYKLELTHASHFYKEYEISPDDVPISHAYEATFNIEPKAWVSVHLQNQDISQTVTVAIEGDTENCSECCSGPSTIIQGWPVDSTLTCLMYGNEDAEVSGTFVDINGGVHVISETVVAAAFDTTVVDIIY